MKVCSLPKQRSYAALTLSEGTYAQLDTVGNSNGNNISIAHSFLMICVTTSENETSDEPSGARECDDQRRHPSMTIHAPEE